MSSFLLTQNNLGTVNMPFISSHVRSLVPSNSATTDEQLLVRPTAEFLLWYGEHSNYLVHKISTFLEHGIWIKVRFSFFLTCVRKCTKNTRNATMTVNKELLGQIIKKKNAAINTVRACDRMLLKHWTMGTNYRKTCASINSKNGLTSR